MLSLLEGMELLGCAVDQVLAQIKGLSEAKVDKLVDAAIKMVPSAGWTTASEYERLVQILPYLSSRPAAPRPLQPSSYLDHVTNLVS